MPNRLNRTDCDALWSAYLELGSIHRAGERFGIGGETARRVLHRSGRQLKNHRWSPAEDQELRTYYATCLAGKFEISEISLRLGRSYAGVACRAGELGLLCLNYRPTDGQRKRMSVSQKNRLAISHPSKGRKFGPMPQCHKDKISQGDRRAFAAQRILGTGQFSDRERRRKSEAMSRLQASRILHGKYQGGQYKHGPREDLGNTCFKSSWEANFARVLNLKVSRGELLSWEYEPDVFTVSINGRVLRYIPDFKLAEPGSHVFRYVEVKGRRRD